LHEIITVVEFPGQLKANKKSMETKGKGETKAACYDRAKATLISLQKKNNASGVHQEQHETSKI
jgi:hypothetical protein